MSSHSTCWVLVLVLIPNLSNSPLQKAVCQMYSIVPTEEQHCHSYICRAGTHDQITGPQIHNKVGMQEGNKNRHACTNSANFQNVIKIVCYSLSMSTQHNAILYIPIHSNTQWYSTILPCNTYPYTMIQYNVEHSIILSMHYYTVHVYVK